MVDACIDFIIRAEYVDGVFVVEQFFNHESRKIEAYDMGLGDDFPKRGHFIVYVKVLRVGQRLQCLVNLLSRPFLLVVSTNLFSMSFMAT